jgi:gamma-glutamyltranspeptidase/glutathione hydrolase
MKNPRKMLWTLVLLWTCVGATFAADPAAVPSQRGMVVSPEAHASHVGASVLNEGGTAADAAVAVALALAVTNPQAGNLGGGGFLLYRDSDGNHAALDFREIAPAALTADLFLDEAGSPLPGLSLESGLAVGVPGSILSFIPSSNGRSSRRRDACVGTRKPAASFSRAARCLAVGTS